MVRKLDAYLNIRIGEDLADALKRAAEADDRSASNYLRGVLSTDLRAKGFLTDTKPAKEKRTKRAK